MSAERKARKARVKVLPRPATVPSDVLVKLVIQTAKLSCQEAEDYCAAMLSDNPELSPRDLQELIARHLAAHCAKVIGQLSHQEAAYVCNFLLGMHLHNKIANIEFRARERATKECARRGMKPPME